MKVTKGAVAVRDLVRTVVDGPGPDRFLSPDMEAVAELVKWWNAKG